MTELLHETEVDGVRCFWIDTHRPTLTAALSFRSGMADEPLAQGGWLHLLEHSALHGRGGGTLQVNGSVGILATQFEAHGPIGRVTELFGAVTGWLGEPQFDDLDRERKVLQAEARLRRGAMQRSFVWRYGSVGPGMVSNDEPGLGLATAAGLSGLARAVFTRPNAVLALDGPPPAGLRLTLPNGAYMPIPEAVSGESGGQMYRDESGLILTGVVERSRAATFCPALLQRAVREWLRDRRGAAYAPWSNYEQVDARHAMVFVGSDVAPEAQDALLGDVLELLDRLNAEGVPEPWLNEHRDEVLQRLADPQASAWQAWRSASLALMGDPPQTLEAAVAELREVDADAIQQSLLEVRDSLLVGVPGRTVRDPRLPEMTFPLVESAPEGRAFRSSNWPADASVLTVAADGLAVTGSGGTLALPVSAAVGLYVFPDGFRTLVGRDGWSLSVEPAKWRDGYEAIAELDRVVPGELHLPQPALDNAPAFEPAPLVQRWWWFLQRKDYFWLLLAVVLTPIVYGLSVLVAAQLTDPTAQMFVRAAPAWITILAIAFMYNDRARGRR